MPYSGPLAAVTVAAASRARSTPRSLPRAPTPRALRWWYPQPHLQVRRWRCSRWEQVWRSRPTTLPSARSPQGPPMDPTSLHTRFPGRVAGPRVTHPALSGGSSHEPGGFEMGFGSTQYGSGAAPSPGAMPGARGGTTTLQPTERRIPGLAATGVNGDARSHPPSSVCPTRWHRAQRICSRPCGEKTNSSATAWWTPSASTSGYRGLTRSTGKSSSSTGDGYMFTFVPSHLSLCHGINISGLSQLGLPVDNLIGLSAHDLYFQLMHRRSSSNASWPSTS